MMLPVAELDTQRVSVVEAAGIELSASALVSSPE
jgi:hypothetical protein